MFVMIFVALAYAAARLLTMPLSHGPVSVSFLGFTNETASGRAVRAAGSECEALQSMPLSHGRPVSVPFFGFTNEPAIGEAVRANGNEWEALFYLTNHTASKMGFHVDVDASGVGSNSVSSFAAAAGNLAAHTAYTLPVLTPGGTNGWRFLLVATISGPRPPWQQGVRALLSRVGAHPLFLASDRTYPQFTNVWTTR